MNVLIISFFLVHIESLSPANRYTRSLSVFIATHARPFTSFSLKITNCSLRYAALYLSNQLPDSFHKSQRHLLLSASQCHHQITTFIITTVTINQQFSLSLQIYSTFSQISRSIVFEYWITHRTDFTDTQSIHRFF